MSEVYKKVKIDGDNIILKLKKENEELKELLNKYMNENGKQCWLIRELIGFTEYAHYHKHLDLYNYISDVQKKARILLNSDTVKQFLKKGKLTYEFM